jgi:multisubunit Na+/H+ antiporter MnhB subunit
MKYILSALLCLSGFIAVSLVSALHPATLEPELYLYTVRNFFADTASKNAVAAVLLNYRMYDTIFEALILLAAIIGMQQFLPHGLENGQRPEGDKLHER